MRFRIKRVETAKDSIIMAVAFSDAVMKIRGNEMSEKASLMFMQSIDEYSAIEIREGLRILCIKHNRINPALLIECINEFKQPRTRIRRFIERVFLGIGPEEMRVRA